MGWFDDDGEEDAEGYAEDIEEDGAVVTLETDSGSSTFKAIIEEEADRVERAIPSSVLGTLKGRSILLHVPGNSTLKTNDKLLYRGEPFRIHSPVRALSEGTTVVKLTFLAVSGRS